MVEQQPEKIIPLDKHRQFKVPNPSSISEKKYRKTNMDLDTIDKLTISVLNGEIAPDQLLDLSFSISELQKALSRSMKDLK